MCAGIMEVNRLDERYRALLAEVLHNGIEKEDRTGTGTLSRFGMTIRHRMEDGFPVLTTKKIPLKTVATELKWFLKGRTDLRYLLENNCHIWTGDAYKVYERVHHWDLEDPEYDIKEFEEQILKDNDFSRLWGNLGFIYGKQWRDWDGNDQIRDLVNNLKNEPNSRRHIVSAWNVQDLIYMKLPPCHYAFQCYVANGKLSLMWQQRSADLFLGVPFNISSYGMLLLLLCKETGYEPGELIGNFGDIHLYKNHIEQAKEQINRKPYALPKLEMLNVDLNQGEFNFVLENYNFHPAIKAPLSN